jgi:hypothetical protein
MRFTLGRWPLLGGWGGGGPAEGFGSSWLRTGARVNAVMNLRVLSSAGNFLTS